ncbi:hypothetical protein M405DRAFT_819875 [Rhizopogon salebrosus TDB-379]|nr:hypothetical protein M405DRAFT_819875 [Rhizopogon salebrosus TDB-379]
MAHNTARTYFGKVSNRAVMHTGRLNKNSLRWGMMRPNIKTTIWSWLHGTDLYQE